MLSLRTSDMMEEVGDAEDLRDKYTAISAQIISRWVGAYYRSDHKPDRPTLENYIDSFIRFVRTQIVFDQPTAIVASEADAEDTATAEGMQGAIAWWVRGTDYKRNLIRAARDIILGWCVTKTYYSVNDLQGAKRLLMGELSPVGGALPCVSVINPGQHGVDAHCWGYENRRLEFSCFDKDIDDLIGNPLYEQDAIATLQPNDARRERKDTPFPEPERRSTNRKQVTLYEIWVPEAKALYTIAHTGRRAGVKIREEEYKGPPEGPYTLWGAMEVPGQIYPFSIMAASYGQFDDLNIHAQQAQKAARSYKRFVAGRKGQAPDAKTMQTVKNGDVALFDNPGELQEKEAGGMADTQVKVLEMLRERLDRNMGYSEAQRGNASKSTATAEQLAQNNSDHRIELLRQAIIDGATNDLRKVGWFFWNQVDINRSYTVENRLSGMKETVEMYGGEFDEDFLRDFNGGEFAGQIGKTWGDYSLRIPVESMTRVADPVRQKRAQEELQFVFGTLVPMYGPQMVNIRRAIDRYGQAFNEQDLSDILLLDPQGMMQPLDPLAGGMQQRDQFLQGGGPAPGAAQMGGMGMGAPTTMPGMMSNARGGVGARG